MLKPIRHGYTIEQKTFRKGPSASKAWYAKMALGMWLEELIESIKRHADVECLEECGLVIVDQYQWNSKHRQQQLQTMILEQDYLAKKLDTLLHKILTYRAADSVQSASFLYTLTYVLIS